MIRSRLAVCRALIAVTLALGAPPSVGPMEGQVPPPDSVVQLSELTVVARREFGLVGGSSAIVFTPQSMNLPPIASVEDALRDIPFVLLRQNSRGQAEISLRGSESRQVAVMLDGVPLTLAWDARTDPSVIPLQGAERIEVIRGLSSLLTGPNVLGGVVNVSIGRNAGLAPISPSMQWSSGFDHEGGYSVGGSFAQPFELTDGYWTVRGGGGWRSRSGVSLPGGIEEIGSDDGVRTNSYFDQLNGFGSARYQSHGGQWASVTASGHTSNRGVPPELHVNDPRLWQYPTDEGGIVSASAGSGDIETPWGDARAELNLGLHNGRQEIESFTSLAYSEIDEVETGEDRTLSARLTATHSIGENGDFSTALTIASIAHTEVLSGTDPDDYRQRIWSLAAETDWSVGARARVGISGALDGAETTEAGGRDPLAAKWAPAGRVGLTLPLEGSPLVLNLSASSRARFPAMRELYSGALGKFEPNPDLGPERLFAVESGATYDQDGLDIQVVGFHQRLEDAVVRTTTSEGKFLRVNQNALETTGLEFLVGFEAGQFEIDGELTVQRARLSTPNGTDRPEHMPAFRSGFDIEIPFMEGYLARGRMEYRGEMYCLDPNLGSEVSLEGHARADAAIERTIQVRSQGRFSDFQARISLDNAFDSTIYDQCGMPQPGRTLSIGIELR